MKSGFKWMVLVAVVTLVSTNAWAVWNPDTDTSLVFNMNFEVFNNAAHTTTAAKPVGLVGTLVDYNSTNPNVFGELSIAGLGYDANFAAMHDNSPGAGIQQNVATPNDVKLTVLNTGQIFDLNVVSVKHTWAFWFNTPDLNSCTFIRHADAQLTTDNHTNLMWEIRLAGGNMFFWHKDNCLKMQTADQMTDLGLTPNTWHSAAIVIDRTASAESPTPTTQASTKIYIDGLEVPVIVLSLNQNNMNVDLYSDFYDSPLWIGAGEREFDGLLDDVRLYSRVLTALEVSILNQPDKSKPVALLPIPRSDNVAITSDLSWSPATGATTQSVYFGTDANNLAFKVSGDGSLSTVTNAQLGGNFSLNTVYYWYVKTNGSNGPLWSFTSETGKARDPSPADFAEDIANSDINLIWTTTSPATYTVYASTNRSLVESGDASVRIASGISDPCIMGFDPCTIGGRGVIYYWRVDSTYALLGTVAGDIWNFRTKPYELVFNTSGVQTTYADQVIPPYTCLAHTDGFSDPCATGYLASDGVAVFDFPSGFNYDKHYDIIVVPSYRATDIDYDFNFPTPLAIHATGNFYFDGRVQIAGDDILTTTQDITFTCSGGFPGPKHNNGVDGTVFNDRTVTASDYWNQYIIANGTQTRFGTYSSSSAHYVNVPTDLGKSIWGPGQPVNPPYKVGGGGGAGGRGGESGRGYYFGIDTRGPSYGDKEVPVPFGGSGGGWGGGSNSPGGAAGGGGIEIIATGNVTLDVNSQIRAWGGGQLCAQNSYPGGGAGGGSVRIIAGGSVTNKGTINVNGGQGGNGSQTNNTGGGGGGGRVAIFYGSTYTNTGIITANGGARGAYYNDPCNLGAPCGLAKDGQNGTIYIVNSSTVSPKKASAPTPADGNYVYVPSPSAIDLKWYSGYGGTTDVVYCDTNPNPTTSRGSVSATRGQHSVSMSVSAGNTYYMKVVTDGTVSSSTWSFTAVNWQCPFVSNQTPHIAGPEWDTNYDCVVDFQDFEYFAQDWMDNLQGQYTLDNADFVRFSNQWRESDR